MPFTVLIVDDSAIMRSIVGKTLRLSGIPLGEVLEASDGAAALEVVATRRVDLALVDINMPRLTGEEFLDRLRASPETARIPVIIVSSESSEARIAALRDKGAEFVHKPFTPPVLRDVILRITGVDPNEHVVLGAASDRGGLDF
jgi:two-component system chemotaxis response regulator CheY